MGYDDEQPRPNTKDVLKSHIEASISEGQPIHFEGENLQLLRQSLIDAGCNLEGLGDEEREKLLNNSQFRSKIKLDNEGGISGVLVYNREGGGRWEDFIDKIPSTEYYDRSAGMLAVLGSEKFSDLIRWCYRAAIEEDYQGGIVGREGTEGRGLQQAAARLIIMAVINDPNNEDFQKAERGLNTALWKGHRKTSGESAELDERFAGYTIDRSTNEGGKKYRQTSSFPPSKLPELMDFLTTP